MKLVGHSSGITDKEYISHYRSQRDKGVKGFIAVDGEGINMPDKTHRYVMLTIGNEQPIVNRNGLSWLDILGYLYGHFRSNYNPNKSNYAYVGFYLGYDFDRWLRTMPLERVARLLTSEGRQSRKSKSDNLHGKVLPVDMPKGWQIDMLGKRWLKIRTRKCHCDIYACKCPGKGPWMHICDAGPFFQTSFLTAIDPREWRVPIVTNAEYELIKKGKDDRDKIIDADNDEEWEEWLKETTPYNKMENAILARLMNEEDKGFRQMGIILPPREWYGPGRAAQKWLENESITTAAEINKAVPMSFLESARMSYFGGWFEIMMHGIIPGETHEYDINSAYPYIIASLPCLLHGKYDSGNGKPTNDTGYVLVYATVSNIANQKDAVIGTMLHRNRDGSVFRPLRTKGWYWLHELNAARKAKLISNVHYIQWESYEPCDCPPPLRNVAGLYEWRLKADKNSPLGKALRLVYNSIYGKMAQSIGYPKFSNPIWASLITAGCRTMILNAIATHPKGYEDVCMVATDAVFFATPHPDLPESKRLGEWSYKCRDNLTLFKPGVYWDDNARRDIEENRAAKFKARGISSADFSSQIAAADRHFQKWNSMDSPMSANSIVEMIDVADWPMLEIPVAFSMVSCLQAIRRNKWETAGQVITDNIVVHSANPFKKRMAIRLPSKTSDGRQIWRTIPWDQGFEELDSMPYLKRFGMGELERQEELGITQHGTVIDVIVQETEWNL